ncbi:MAG: DNA sulfur modification protein DndD [Planctomycetota bacterium]
MRIDELVLNNIGPYRGEQRADLRPTSTGKPVVLFGGLNGAGKTTILEAVQLALYGNLSEPARRSGLAYDEYLHRAANRSAPPSEGSAIGLSFTLHEGGRSASYRIRRTWSATGGRTKKVREELDVWVDGEHDPAMSAAWAEQVAQFLPPRLAPLFFFDGERIEQLADPEQSAEALRTAVGALLGADLVDQLGTDLDVLLRRRQVERATDDDDRLLIAEATLEEAEAQRCEAVQRVASAKAAVERAEELSRRAGRHYAEQGGLAADARRETETMRAAATEKQKGIEREMAILAAGDLPLAIVTPLLKKANDRAARQKKLAERRIASKVLIEATERLTSELIEAKAAKKTLKLVREWANRESADDGNEDSPAPDAAATSARLQHLLSGSLDGDQVAAKRLLARHADATAKVDELDRSLAMTPDADAVAEAAQARQAALVELGALQQQHAAAIEAEAVAARDVERQQRELDRLLDAARAARGEAADAERFTRHTKAVQAALGRFGAKLRRRHLERLEKLVLECYQSLMRKTELAVGLRISPDTYALTLTDTDGVEVQPERLSAGERQLLAVSMLWAMARASGRPLPVVVDTPLGRLDGTHRRRLVERYFPNAASQVIVLSTDEEVDAGLYAILKPRIGRAYQLDHDERSGTRITPGYPFSGDATAVRPKDIDGANDRLALEHATQ